MPNEPTREQIEQIGDALARGQKIEAIKVYREVTGNDLKAAKDFIDALIPKLKAQDPEKYQDLAAAPAGGGKGCSGMLLLCMMILLVLFAGMVLWILNGAG